MTGVKHPAWFCPACGGRLSYGIYCKACGQEMGIQVRPATDADRAAYAARLTLSELPAPEYRRPVDA